MANDFCCCYMNYNSHWQYQRLWGNNIHDCLSSDQAYSDILPSDPLFVDFQSVFLLLALRRRSEMAVNREQIKQNRYGCLCIMYHLSINESSKGKN